MKNALVVLALLLVPGLVGAGVYWQRTQSLGAHLARARAVVGSREASAALAASADRFPENAELQMLAARQFGFEAKFARAEEYLQRAGVLNWPRAAVERQHWLFLLHTDFREAEPHLQLLREVDPNDEEVLVGLALGYTQISRIAMAEALADRALQLNPESGPAHCARGKVYLHMRMRDRALADLEQALALGPNSYYEPTAEFLEVICLRQLGRYEQGYQLAKRCQPGQPKNVLLLFYLGLCARHTDRLDEALEAFQAVLRLHPDDGDTLFELAHVYEEKRDYQKARELLENIEHDYPDDPQLLAQMAKILQLAGDNERAAGYQERYRASELLRREQAPTALAPTDERNGPLRPEPLDK